MKWSSLHLALAATVVAALPKSSQEPGPPAPPKPLGHPRPPGYPALPPPKPRQLPSSFKWTSTGVLVTPKNDIRNVAVFLLV